MTDTKFKKGRAKTGGKKKGTPNKFTTLKQAFLEAFQDKRIGGTEGMVEVFSKNDARKIDFFKLISKMLPTSMNAEVTNKYEDDVIEKFKAMFKDIGVPNVDEFITRFRKFSDESSGGKTKVLAKTRK